jgi:beta-barrel assembly-enhancing protease
MMSNPILNVGTQLSAQLLNLKFSRGQEFEADNSGMNYIIRSSYDRNAAIDVFRVLRAASGSNGRQIEFLQTHPLSESRIEALRQEYGLKEM